MSDKVFHYDVGWSQNGAIETLNIESYIEVKFSTNNTRYLRNEICKLLIVAMR